MLSQTFFILTLFLSCSNALSQSQFDEISGRVYSSLDRFWDVQPTVVRLGFHDCVGSDGCNGCLDLTNPDNSGLTFATNYLEPIYQDYGATVLSRADFWALSAITAVELGIDIANSAIVGCGGSGKRRKRKNRRGKNKKNKSPKQGQSCVPPLQMTFRWGRLDCRFDDDNYNITSDDIYPSPEMNNAEVTNYFNAEFGLTAEQTVALLGAHTLGLAQTNQSGYDGFWLQGKSKDFDNEFYKVMIDPNVVWENRVSSVVV